MASKSGVTDIVNEFSELEKIHAARNRSYDEVLQFYAGSTLEEAQKARHIKGISASASSMFSPLAEDEDPILDTPINLVKPAIENKVAFLALPPTVRIIEPPDQLAPMPAKPGGPGMPGNDPEAMGQIPEPIPGAAPMAPVPGQEPMVPGMPPGPAPTPTDGGVPLAPGPTDADWGIDFADREERVLNSLLAMSNMPQRCRDVAWSMAAMDGAVIGAWPDVRHGRPRLFTRTPQNFYPISYDPDGLELQKAMWSESLTSGEVTARYGESIGKKYGTKEDIHVIQYIDEEKFCTILDKTEFAHPPMENKMGLVPIVCVGNLGLPGMIFGSTDVKDSIPVAKQINNWVYLIREMSSAMIRPTIAVKDPISVPDDIAIGRGGVITMGPNGNVELLGPINLPSAFWQLGAQFERWFDIISDNPAILRSDEGGGLTTGKGFNARLGPIAARMQQRLEILMSAYRQAFKYMLLMWADFPGMKSVKASGVKMKESFYIDAMPQDFMVNGQMWTEMDVYLDAQSYIDRQGNAVEIMQLYQNELIDWDTAVNSLNQVQDRKRTRTNIDKDRQWKAEGMATAQAAAQSAMTANVPLASQEKTNFGLNTGFMGETPPMPGPEGAAPAASEPTMMQAGGEEPSDQSGQIVEILREFFSGIPKLRGDVWFGGDPLTAPERIASDDWTVTVWCSDPQDIGTITRASEKVDVLYGHLRFKRGVPSPDEKTIQVAGAAGNVAPPTGEEEMMEEQLPTSMGEVVGATPPMEEGMM